jgi:hypothetical protein
MNRARMLLPWLGLALLCLWPGRAVSGETGEDQLRKEVGQAYASPRADDRKAALQRLMGCKEKGTLAMLLMVAQGDKDKDVRVVACDIASRWEDEDSAVAGAVVQVFSAERDREAKREIAGVLPNLRFKYAPLNAVVKFVSSLGYPDEPLPGTNIAAGGGTTSYAAVNKAREYFESVLGAFNALSGQSVKASRDARQEVMKWWSKNSADFHKQDAELAMKLRAEAEARKKAEAEAKKKEAEAKKSGATKP